MVMWQVQWLLLKHIDYSTVKFTWETFLNQLPPNRVNFLQSLSKRTSTRFVIYGSSIIINRADPPLYESCWPPIPQIVLFHRCKNHIDVPPPPPPESHWYTASCILLIPAPRFFLIHCSPNCAHPPLYESSWSMTLRIAIIQKSSKIGLLIVWVENLELRTLKTQFIIDPFYLLLICFPFSFYSER